MSLAVTNRRRAAVWAAAAAVICALVAPPALAQPTPAPAPPKVAAAADGTLQDFSSALPRTTRDEVTGDFLGLGYDQHMRAEGAAINIYDPPALGGTLRKSAPLDLAPPPDDPWFWYRNENIGTISPWADNILATDCLGCFAAADNVYHLRSIYLAVVGDSLYISGTKGDSIDGGNNDTFPPAGYSTYRNLLYKVPVDLECAREDCASDPSIGKVVELPWLYLSNPERSVGVTALAAGTSGGNEFVAVGLTDYGTIIYNGDLTSSAIYSGMPTGYQTPVSTLAFDPGGSGMLAVGLLSPGAHSLTTQVNPDGTVTATRGYLALGGGPNLNPFPLASTFGHRADGSLVVAFGYNDGSVRIGDPQGLNGQELAGGTSPAGISVMDAVPRPDGGADDYAVAMQKTADITGPLIGGSWRWDEDQATFTAQKVAADAQGNGTTVLPDRDAYRSWFPGFKQGRFTVTNSSDEEVTVALKARPDVGYGCWWAGTWSDATPFPSGDLTLAPGASTPGPDGNVMGGYTAGPDGTCAASDASGEWRGYLIVTPTAHPADARIVNLHLGRNWTLDVTDQTGGSTTVSAQKTGQLGPLGAWELTVDTPDPPTPAPDPRAPAAGPAVPSVTATVLTTSKTGRASVYRFDVDAMKWTVPLATDTTKNPSLQAVIPPLQVQGLSGTTWQTIGYLMPNGRMTGDATSVTVAASTFYWENTKAATYSQIRVFAGGPRATDPVPYPSIVLASLTGPTPTTISAISATPTTAVDTQSNAIPSANGIDQSTLLVSLTGANGLLSSTDPAYKAVYFRRSVNGASGALITNLYSTATTNPAGDYAKFVGVQPDPGAVIPQSRTDSNSSAFNDYYVDTTTTASQDIRANISLGATVSAQNTLTVDAGNLDPTGPGVDTPGGTGFSLEGCAGTGDYTGSSTCRIANATRTAPAPFQAGLDADTSTSITGLPLLGVALGSGLPTGTNGLSSSYRVVPAQSYLPLEWPMGPDGRKLVSSAASVKNKQAQITFDTTPFKPADHVDLDLVTHGQIVDVTVEAGGG